MSLIPSKSRLFNNTVLPDDYVLASLDVVSLFSNVYLQACLRSINKNWHRIELHTGISRESFLELITFLFNSTYFAFDGRFYKQTFGTPMGASISPILANYVMDDLLDTVIPTLSFNLHFIKKYVDDIILALPRDKVTEIMVAMNSFDQHIQFTMENEDEGNSVPFLDTKFIRNSNNSVSIDWYRKPCTSGRFINYLSYHRQSMKINLVKQMKNRVQRISDTTFHNKNFNILFQIFKDNSYPTPLLKKILFSTSRSTEVLQSHTSHNNLVNPQMNNPATAADSPLGLAPAEATVPFVLYTSLPYIRDITPKLTSFFSKAFTNIKIANRSVLPIKSIHSNLKDKVPILAKSDVVYCIPCSSCDKTYIGQTTRQLKDRIVSHKSDSRLHPERCALADHVHSLQHQMDYDSVRVLTSESHYSKRLFKEMAFISQSDNCMNKKSDINHLSEIYSYLLHLDKGPNLNLNENSL